MSTSDVKTAEAGPWTPLWGLQLRGAGPQAQHSRIILACCSLPVTQQ